MLFFVLIAVTFRLLMLLVSHRNEKALLAEGGREFGAANSMILACAHTLFYPCGAFEGLVSPHAFDTVSTAGLMLYVFGAGMLLIVLRLLGRQWTVKLIVARRHALVTHALFRTVRHPNDYLNVLPELVGYALTLHAFATLCLRLPLYLLPLIARIRLEENAMRAAFPAY